MESVKNPISRIYAQKRGSSSYDVFIEVNLSRELELRFGKKISKLELTLKDNWIDEDDIDSIMEELYKIFGITLQKSNLGVVTFVNMFCSDKDAKLSDKPEPILAKPNSNNLLL